MTPDLDDWGRERSFTAPPPAPPAGPAGQAFFTKKRGTADLENRVAELEAMICRSGETAKRRIDELEARVKELEDLVITSGDMPVGVALSAPWVQRLVVVVADHWQVSAMALVGRGRTACVTRPRFVLCWLLRQSTDYSLPMIARMVGYLDHTAAVHALNRVNDWREKDEVVQHETNQLLIIARRLHADWAAAAIQRREGLTTEQVTQ
jgi:hypothetical protein